MDKEKIKPQKLEEDEAKELQRLHNRRRAIECLQENLINGMEEVEGETRSFWLKLAEKYKLNLYGKRLVFNRETKEVCPEDP